MTVKGKTDTNGYPFQEVNRSLSVRTPKKIRSKRSTSHSNGLHIRSNGFDIRSNGSGIHSKLIATSVRTVFASVRTVLASVRTVLASVRTVNCIH